MAANKFATMLHRNSNKITLILIYAVLEWTLIILLLLNALFSYLIIKFADYFGLKPPCLWCSRVDHIFEPGKGKNMHRDLLCEVHATEISKLGYCSNHRKLAESQYMCEDCLPSRPDVPELSKNFDFLPWMKQVGMIQSDEDKVLENGAVRLNCSCCGVSLENKIRSPYIVIKPSWGDLDYTQKRNWITETGDDDHIEDGDNSDHSRSDLATDRCEHENEHGFENKSENQMLSDVNEGFGVREEEAERYSSVSIFKLGVRELEGDEDDEVGMVSEVEKETIKEDNSSMTKEDQSVQVCTGEDDPPQILPQHLEFFIDCSGHQLVPVELIDSKTEEDHGKYSVKEEGHEHIDNQDPNLVSELYLQVEVKSVVENSTSLREPEAELSVHENKKEPKFQVLESMDIEEDENSVVFHANNCHPVWEFYDLVDITQATQIPSRDDEVQAMAAECSKEKDADVPPAFEEVHQIPMSETEADVSIGTDIPDLETTDEIQTQETSSSYACTHEDASTSAVHFHTVEDYGSEKAQEEMAELRTFSAEVCEGVINNHSSLGSEFNEVEEDKVPDTPTSTDSFHHLHKKLLLLEKKDSGTEESLDGSVVSEFEGGDGVLTVDRLTSALRAERKALHALYAELEEERSASAVAANQTMAMINRLQEEKAAVQMEALQYQRMMEEQSEYDQEALQLLNELMVKREKEKQELEKELEIYRKKLLDYEAKEKVRMLRRSKDGSARSGFFSASSSNAEDSDGLSIDLNQEAKEDDSFYSHRENGNHNTPVDAVLNLEESLANFEEERLSILEQLKFLEEKLITLSDEEDQHFEDVSPVEQFHEQNGKHLDEHADFGSEAKGLPNGFPKEINGNHRHKKIIVGSKGKTLLPLFDAIGAENGDVVANGHENGFISDGEHNSIVTKFESENQTLAIAEEVDNLYGRLQALEADREFLRHCVSSVKKGDKGMYLLQEILQHLRDLRNVELRVRNFSDGALA
ncbi:unnamed protein product [Ilex paraguariensis]|uniref:GTD-binding domain-containing protein n=1 Tax=Ilex paraguariensis TaxID=185542 RepID=A0ABC8QNJ7_9AQUA